MNDGITKDLCSLSYVSIDTIVARAVNLGRGDLKSAYRHIPVHPDDKWRLGMDWNGMLYVDSTLPFNLRFAPVIFNTTVEALAYIIRQKGVTSLDHYLDDFSLVGAPKSPECGENLQMVLSMCEEVAFMVALEKIRGPVTLISLLG